MGHDPTSRRLLLTPDIGDDQSPVLANAQLSAMALAYPSSFNEAERLREPRNRSAHIGVHKHRNDGGGRDRTVALHRSILWPLFQRSARVTCDDPSRLPSPAAQQYYRGVISS